MNIEAKEKKTRVRELLLARLREILQEISVPKLTRWIGLQPIPQGDYKVKYHDDAAEILGRVGNLDQRLTGLRRRIRVFIHFRQICATARHRSPNASATCLVHWEIFTVTSA